MSRTLSLGEVRLDMQAKLYFLSGPLKGAIVDLEDGSTVVGRDAASRIYIDDSRLSRRHCEFVRQSEQVMLRDSQSRNGVFVNGVPVKERVLDSGDQIQIGESILFFFIDTGEQTEPADSGKRTERHLLGRTTDESPFHGSAAEAGTLSTPRASAALEASRANWLTFVTALVSVQEIEALKVRLTEAVSELLGVDRVAFVPAHDRPDLGSVVACNRLDRAFPLDAALARQAARERLAVVVANAAAQSDWILCAPLLVGSAVIGAVYLGRLGARFEQSELTLAAAAAGLVAMALENVRQAERLERDNARLSADLNRDRPLIGETAVMRDIGRLIARAAPNDSTVLILGESGTGKELAARAMHAQSRRAKRLFTPINCASLSDTLLESHLFGHERGAFTGAVAQKQGLLEITDGGTVFLDEVGELPLNLQARLLRVLQDQEFERVGGTRRIKVSLRIIAATNKNLKEAVRAGKFREDLYFRLRVIEITMPPLRERRDDVELLARYFVQKHAQRCGRRVSGITAAALEALVGYDWPGNVRELENAIERAIALGSTDEVLVEDLPDDLLDVSSTDDGSTLRAALKATKVEGVRKALEQAGGSYADAAKLLGIHANALHRMIRHLGLRDDVRAMRARLALSDSDG